MLDVADCKTLGHNVESSCWTWLTARLLATMWRAANATTTYNMASAG
jgi:hypothetical protein